MLLNHETQLWLLSVHVGGVCLYAELHGIWNSVFTLQWLKAIIPGYDLLILPTGLVFTPSEEKLGLCSVFGMNTMTHTVSVTQCWWMLVHGDVNKTNNNVKKLPQKIDVRLIFRLILCYDNIDWWLFVISWEAQARYQWCSSYGMCSISK